MGNEYTPTTNYSQVVPNSSIPFTSHIRNMYAVGTGTLFSPPPAPERHAEFDRWLASHEAELREKIAKEIEAVPETTWWWKFLRKSEKRIAKDLIWRVAEISRDGGSDDIL